MEGRYLKAARTAAGQAGAISLDQLQGLGVDRRLRSDWVRRAVLVHAGPRSFVIVGAPPTWKQDVWTASMDVRGRGFVAGRSAAQLHGLDGFRNGPVELLVPRAHRGVRSRHILRSTSFALTTADTVSVDGIRCLTVERLILDAYAFGFKRHEIENAIDSGIRNRLVSEQRLVERARSRHRACPKGSRLVVDSLVDSGGESMLERRFLRLLRRSGLPRPELQRVFRDGGRTVARVDAALGGGLIVESAGHATHSTRQQRQHDEQRRTELTLMGHRVITFTYEDCRDRPEWVIETVRQALVEVF